jgi:hypothetical protein
MLVDDGKTLLVNDIIHATTTVYDVEPVSKTLSVRKKVVRRNPSLSVECLADIDPIEPRRRSRQPLRDSRVRRYRCLWYVHAPLLVFCSTTLTVFSFPVFPDPIKLGARLLGDNVLNSSITGPAAVLRLKKEDNYEPEVIYWDDGSLITILTGAAIDPVRKKMIAGGVVERHFIVCDLNGVKF